MLAMLGGRQTPSSSGSPKASTEKDFGTKNPISVYVDEDNYDSTQGPTKKDLAKAKLDEDAEMARFKQDEEQIRIAWEEEQAKIKLEEEQEQIRL